MAAAAEHEFAASRLKITEIFFSIQGEALGSGWPTVFVRLTGCPLRCQYCDTAYAFTGGVRRSRFDQRLRCDSFEPGVLRSTTRDTRASTGEMSIAPLVSSDFNHNPASSLYDSSLTKVIEGKLVKVCSWYDNEWGFSNRMLDTTLAFAAAK